MQRPSSDAKPHSPLCYQVRQRGFDPCVCRFESDAGIQFYYEREVNVNRSLDSILGSFSKVQRELETYIDAESAKNSKDEQEIVRLNAAVAARSNDIDRAGRVRDKVVAITS